MKTEIKVMICQKQFMLRSSVQEDIEVLRLWKNYHKEFFFYKNEITKEEQYSWFNALAERANDHMFIIEDKQNPVGCIGARLYSEYVDIYNVILGDKNYKGKHIMKNALWAVVSLSNFIYNFKPVCVSVLKSNPAINWYEKIGFEKVSTFEKHVVMQFMNNTIDTKYNFCLNITLP